MERARRLLPGLWLGFALCVALLAAPAPFATLAPADAGRVVARMLAQEAHTSLALGIAVLVLERLAARRASAAGTGSQFSTGMLLALGTLACTIVGYFVVQPLMVAARAGESGAAVSQLHTISVVMFAIKLVLIAALAWRAAGWFSRPASS